MTSNGFCRPNTETFKGEEYSTRGGAFYTGGRILHEEEHLYEREHNTRGEHTTLGGAYYTEVSIVHEESISHGEAHTTRGGAYLLHGEKLTTREGAYYSYTGRSILHGEDHTTRGGGYYIEEIILHGEKSGEENTIHGVSTL